MGGFLECAVNSKEVSVAKLRGQVGKEQGTRLEIFGDTTGSAVTRA